MSKKIEAVATKIAGLETKLAELKAQHASLLEADAAAQAAANIEVGQVVRFSAGRGETKQELEGKVLVVVPNETGKLLKVLTGEGATTKLYDVAANKVTPVVAGQTGEEGVLNSSDAQAGVQAEADRTGTPQVVADSTGGTTVIEPQHAPVDPADILG